MPNGTTEDWVGKLQDALTELKISSVNVEAKLDQIQIAFQKIESNMEDMQSASSDQETRLQLLEAHCGRIPDRLNEDLALLKAQVSTYQKFLWVVTIGLTGVIINIFFRHLI